MSDVPQMIYDGELLAPERGYTETLPWGVVRVAGRNRPDTVSNPSYFNCTFRLISREMLDWFKEWYNTTLLEGSLPFECSLGICQIISTPTYSNNTGFYADVSMQLELQEDTDICNDQNVLWAAEYFGDDFKKAKRILEQAINGY